jgi:hypothetical protein
MERGLETNEEDEQIYALSYLYRAIVANREDKSDHRIVHWDNQRAEDSENRIIKPKLRFGSDVLPCSNFQANALYLLIATLFYTSLH